MAHIFCSPSCPPHGPSIQEEDTALPGTVASREVTQCPSPLAVVVAVSAAMLRGGSPAKLICAFWVSDLKVLDMRTGIQPCI